MEKNGTGAQAQQERFYVYVVFGVVAFMIVAGVLLYVRHIRLNITTDDAYVTGHVHAIASRVAGTVSAVHVQDNQLVKAGDLLVEIDSRDYDVKVRDSQASVETETSKLSEMSVRVDVAERQLDEIRTRIDTARAALALQEANLRQAGQDLARARTLHEKGVFAEATLEKAETAHDIARAQVDAAREQVKQALASQETQKLVIDQARTALKSQGFVVEQKRQVLASSGLMQGYTKIHAPAEGYVTRKGVEVGNQVSPGQPLMSVVPLDNVWIVANYKETQLADVRPGQKVRIKVDMYPGRVFRGTVDSIMAGTGSVFSLFPPENATGNYVKVVQRIPLKILLEKGSDPRHVLRVGMSVRPTISIRD